MKYAIVTFGCRVNQADSFEFEDSLRARGAEAAPVEDADLIVVNTCTVTGAADQGARNLIRRVARDNGRARIVVTGCYATRQPEEVASLPQVVRLVPNGGKDGFAAMLRRGDLASLAEAEAGASRGSGAEVTTAHRFGDADSACGIGVQPGAMGRTASPLRVQTGCEEHCAFCIIPSTRGSSRSRPVAEICARAERLAGAGYKELWLAGVHLGSYGRDLGGGASLPALLRSLDRVRGDVTFRISSLEPVDCSREILDLVATSGRFAPHFHLPLQHACDRVLALMRRPYVWSFYADLVDRIHARLPHASIGTDLIAGFPGETGEDADRCAALIERLPLAYVHVFPYSDRPGTAASAMMPKVKATEVKRRAERLRRIGKHLADRFVASNAGAVRPGLTLDDGMLVLTDNFLKVRIPPGLARNTRVQVRIDSAVPVLEGHLV